MGNYCKQIKLKYVADNGDEVEFIPSEFIPLGYDDLMAEGPYKITAKVEEGDAEINENILDKGTIEFFIDFNSDVSIYVLNIGGWLPFTCLNNQYIVPDSNVLISIKGIKNNSSCPNIAKTKWWLESRKNSDLTFNLIFYAIEGKKRKPTFEEFCIAFDNAVSDLREFFPNAKVISYTKDIQYKDGYDIFKKLFKNFDQEKDFLIKTAPLIAETPASKKLYEIEEMIQKYASEYKILGDSLPYFLVLSCLYTDPKDKLLAARKVLKPKKEYLKEHAYNTLADLNALLLFITTLYLPGAPFQVCTCDKPLAAFWSALNATILKREDGKITVSFDISENLFSRLNLEQRTELAERMKNRTIAF